MPRGERRRLREEARKAPPDDVVRVFSIEQGSDEWRAARLGIPTASVFSCVMAEGRDGESKTRKRLMSLLAAEIISGIPAETYSNLAMARGKEMEPWAVEKYSFENEVDPIAVGFVERTIINPLGLSFRVGCSPDALVGSDGGLEIKTMQPDLLCDLIESGRIPSEHRAQIQGSLWVTGRAWWHLQVCYRDFPIAPLFRFERDESYISALKSACERFCWELNEYVDRIKHKGKM